MLNWNATEPVVPEVAVAAREQRAEVGDGPVDVVRRGLDEQRDAVGAVALVEHLVVARGVLAHGPLDGGVHLLLGHVDALGVLHHPPELRVHVGVRATGFDGDHDVLPDAGKLLRHAVVAREHGVLALLEHPAHACGGLVGPGS